MKYFGEDFKKIYASDRSLFIFMALNLLASIALIIFSITKINPNSPLVKIGYSDISGYHDGSWTELIAFPLLGITFGVLHSLISVMIFHKRGAGMAKFFLVTTTTLIAGAFIVLIRISAEG
ncbi:hypothetical protein IJG96_01175 [Candidatus Saccharibacteria bacterium]|nr:hypothetical protein [Candidatus Saccharibacteria bacterium]